jgi:hypothetical protein
MQRFCASMTRRAMLAGSWAPGRATHTRQVKRQGYMKSSPWKSRLGVGRMANTTTEKCKGKGKVFLVQAVEALRVARGWGSHIFRHSAHRWWQGCQSYAPIAFYPQEDSWYSLEAESTPG